MPKLLETLRKVFRGRSESSHGASAQRRESQFVGRSSRKEIEQASPERVGELVGHAVERVET